MRQKISFLEFEKNRSNYEYVKEFFRLNDYQPHVHLLNSKSGDVIQVNKGFIHGLVDDEDAEGESDTKFEFLATESQQDIGDIDFQDPAALLRRQRKILERIKNHQTKSKFDPLKILRKPKKLWLIIMCHGGKFVLQVYQNDKMVYNKTESKYVSRGKQGGRQMNADKSKNISSVGSQIRRENEKLLQQYIKQDMEDASEYIQKADVIFLHAPGLNKAFFMSHSRSLEKYGHKVRSIEFKSQKANFKEAKEMVQKICQSQIVFKTEDKL